MQNYLENMRGTVDQQEFERQTRAVANMTDTFTRELREENRQFYVEVDSRMFGPNARIDGAVQGQHRGLTPARIQRFHQFQADESLVGDRCGVCLDDIEFGRRMMRLDCNGKHVFCRDCVKGWFADHNTCPNCRRAFA